MGPIRSTTESSSQGNQQTKSCDHGEATVQRAAVEKSGSTHVLDTMISSIDFSLVEVSDLTPPHRNENFPVTRSDRLRRTSRSESKRSRQWEQMHPAAYNCGVQVAPIQAKCALPRRPNKSPRSCETSFSSSLRGIHYIGHEECVPEAGLRLLPDLEEDETGLQVDDDEEEEELVALHKLSKLPSVRLRPRIQPRQTGMFRESESDHLDRDLKMDIWLQRL